MHLFVFILFATLCASYRRRQPVGGDWWAAVHGVTNSRPWLATSLSLFTFMHWRRKWQPTPVFLPGESQGRDPRAAVYGVTQSPTRLQRLSSSSSSLAFYSASLIAQLVTNLLAMQETGVRFPGKIPWRRKWWPAPVLLPRKSHGGRRSLVGCSPSGSPSGQKESATT